MKITDNWVAWVDANWPKPNQFDPWIGRIIYVGFDRVFVGRPREHEGRDGRSLTG